MLKDYSLIGSTEWVEENRDMLSSRAVAYLNVDCAVSGPGFHASATPQLDELIKMSAQEVQDPDNANHLRILDRIKQLWCDRKIRGRRIRLLIICAISESATHTSSR